MKYKLTILYTVFSFFVLSAQETPEKALKNFQNKAYFEAAVEYNEYLANQQNVSKDILLNAADANFYIREFRQAALYYERAYNFKNNLEAPYVFRYANSLRRLRDVDEANKILLNHYKSNGDLERYEAFQRDIEIQDSLSKDPYYVRYELNNLNINTSNSDFAPVYRDDNLYFTSSAKNSNKSNYSWNKQPYLSIYQTSLLENGSYGMPEKIASEMGVSFHEATLAFHPNDSTVFFSANSSTNSLFKKSEKNSFKLYKGYYNGEDITNIESLYFNSNFYSVGHPTITNDGRYLFFASDMPDGYGQADIYYVEIYEDGLIGSVKNAGPLVNTVGNDFFPHIKDDLLYFASDGHLGFGGLDLYSISYSQEEFRNRTNLGKGINTNYDEFAVYFKDDVSGFLSSNRPKGKGDDDIYSFTKNTELTCVAQYSIKVLDRLSNEPIPNVALVINNLYDSESENLITNDNGTVNFDMFCFKNFKGAANKEGYLEVEFDREDFVMNENTGEMTILLYNPEAIFEQTMDNQTKLKLPRIYFELGKWNITEEASLVLNKVVQVLEAFPEMTIRIESHTDSRDTDERNLILSNRRAIATRDYLYSNGVDEGRIESAVGFGEYRLLNECKDNVVCSEEEHLKNRRSDFIIVKDMN